MVAQLIDRAPRRAKMPPAILLSIRPEHAERIFQGSKRYELRKVLPSFDFGRVFLYETGGRGIVGCFDVGSVLRKSPDRLWKIVGNAATTHERFVNYFNSAESGYAIEVRAPVRFKKPFLIRDVADKFTGISPPQNFIVLEPSNPMYDELERQRNLSLRRHPADVTLRKIRPENRDTYSRLVLRMIRPNYEDIDESFAKSALKIHDLGYDPAGFFTTKKEVLEVRNHGARLIGFTTLTYKSGGCVKTGPTILLPPFRNKGYGVSTRRAIEKRIRLTNARKIYCTCPERAQRVIRYLLASGMRIEAHLERHYATTHNELVFGKLLQADEPLNSADTQAMPDISGSLCDPSSFTKKKLIRDFARLFEWTWSPVSSAFAKAIVKQATNLNLRGQTSKPKRLVCLGRGSRCVGAIVLLPKRGRAIKGVFLRGTRHAQSLRILLDGACRLAWNLGGRKIYFLHPLSDSTVLALLASAGFQTEGLIRAPYRPGQDAVVASKFL